LILLLIDDDEVEVDVMYDVVDEVEVEDDLHDHDVDMIDNDIDDEIFIIDDDVEQHDEEVELDEFDKMLISYAIIKNDVK